MEDAIRKDASWARAVNAFVTVAGMLETANDGRTTYTVSGPRGTDVVTAIDHGEARRARNEVLSASLVASAAIESRTRSEIANLSRVLQRNTLLPGGVVGGFVVMAVPRASACSHIEQSTASGFGQRVNDPCKFTLTANLAGDSHTFSFDEVFASPRSADPRRDNRLVRRDSGGSR
jgi:hypothetical protein